MDCQLIILLPGVKGATTKLEETQDPFPVDHPSWQSIRTLAGLGASDYTKAKSTELWPRKTDKTRLSSCGESDGKLLASTEELEPSSDSVRSWRPQVQINAFTFSLFSRIFKVTTYETQRRKKMAGCVGTNVKDAKLVFNCLH